MRKTAALTILFLAVCEIALAQSSFAVRAGRLVDVEGGAILSNQVILIEGERIKAVGASVPLPAGVPVIDLGGATVLPGLIDAHTHLLSNTGDWTLMVTQMGTVRRALLGAAHGREALDAGLTTVRDLGNSGWNGDVALRDAINAGWVQGPRMGVSTRALSPVGGQFFRGLTTDRGRREGEP